jgi:hypothetical protein
MSGFRAKDEARTRDPDLGKVVLYQLSYFRIGLAKVKQIRFLQNKTAKKLSSTSQPLDFLQFKKCFNRS